jgi:hypothetical protein
MTAGKASGSAVQTPAQAAEANASQPERELRIELWRDEFVAFEGSAAQLQAEGVIPGGFEWPRAATMARWEESGFSYWLFRVRPKGHKGPPSSWWPLDNWCIRICVVGRDNQWHISRRLARKTEELRAEFHRHTAAGHAEWHERYRRHAAAQADRHFQAFKALVPGLVPPKRGRKSLSA